MQIVERVLEGLCCVIRMYLNLAVVTESVNKRKHRITSSSVDQYINFKQGEVIFHICFLKFAKFDAAIDVTIFPL